MLEFCPFGYFDLAQYKKAQDRLQSPAKKVPDTNGGSLSKSTASEWLF
jgi:hypothetical protein